MCVRGKQPPPNHARKIMAANTITKLNSVRINNQTVFVGDDVRFTYHNKRRGGSVEKLGLDFLTLRLDDDDDATHKNFRYDKMSSFFKIPCNIDYYDQ